MGSRLLLALLGLALAGPSAVSSAPPPPGWGKASDVAKADTDPLSAYSRSEAFAACAWTMDEVKRIVPIWKTEAGPRKARFKSDGHRRRRASHRKVP